MTRPGYPTALRLDLVEQMHGRQVADPYRWLEDADDPRTVEWSAAQDALYATASAGWVGRERVRRRIAELVATGVVTAPAWRGGRQFFLRRGGDQEHPRVLTVDTDGTERTLIDPDAIDPTGTTTLDAWQPSKEGRLLAYQLSHGGTEESALRVLDVDTGDVVEGPIDRTRYSPVAWLPGGEAYYYVRTLPPDQVPAGEEQFHRRVYLHRVGTDPATDVLVFGEGMDPTNYYGVSVSRDGHWLSVSAAPGTAPRNDLWVADLTACDPASPDLRPVQVDVDAQTAIEFGRDGLAYVYTDRDAPRGRILVTAPDRLDDPPSWRELVPENPAAVLEGWAVVDGPALDRPRLLVNLTSHATSRITVHDLQTGAPLGELPLPGVGTVTGVQERPEGGHEVWFGYTDFATPTAVYRYDAAADETSVWAVPPGRVDLPDVRSQQVTYPSADGTDIRMFLITPDGPARPRPTILYGYGGFGVPQTPAFSASILTWVEAGGAYAVANLRGGSEEGEDWHRAGMREHKQRTFDDLHAAAEWLVDQGVTTSSMLTISGGSNGGLLVGVALTQRPELYAAVVCSAPLLDMVRYERFGLGRTWNEEYGSADDPDEFGWLIGYSPYHAVREGVAYPAVLFTVFEGDTRVDPLHARKMAAALQHASASDRPVLLRLEADVGHGGRAVSRAVDLSADVLAFAAEQTGLALEP